MTFTQLSDDFTDRPGFLRLTRSARLLHIEALVYCNRHLTDGYLPRAALPRISDDPEPERSTAVLVAGGLWEPVADEGWQLDWTDQEPAEKVRQRQKHNREKQAAFRDRRDRHARGDHSRCDPRFCPRAGVTGYGAGSATGEVTGRVTDTHPSPALPSPAQPEGQGQGGWESGLPDGADAPPGPATGGTAVPANRRNAGRACDCPVPNWDESGPDAECTRCGGGRP